MGTRPQGRNVQPVNIVGISPGVVGPIPVKGDPGATIDSQPFVAVPAGTTVDLPLPPAGTRSMTVQVPIGSALTNVLIREKGGMAGAGRLLVYLGSTLYGGADGAIEQLEAQNIAGPDCQISVVFEGD